MRSKKKLTKMCLYWQATISALDKWASCKILSWERSGLFPNNDLLSSKKGNLGILNHSQACAGEMGLHRISHSELIISVIF